MCFAKKKASCCKTRNFLTCQKCVPTACRPIGREQCAVVSLRPGSSTSHPPRSGNLHPKEGRRGEEHTRDAPGPLELPAHHMGLPTLLRLRTLKADSVWSPPSCSPSLFAPPSCSMRRAACCHSLVCPSLPPFPAPSLLSQLCICLSPPCPHPVPLPFLQCMGILVFGACFDLQAKVVSNSESLHYFSWNLGREQKPWSLICPGEKKARCPF